MDTDLIIMAIQSQNLNAIALADLEPSIVIIYHQVHILRSRVAAGDILKVLLCLSSGMLGCHHLLRSHLLCGSCMRGSCVLSSLKMIEVDEVL